MAFQLDTMHHKDWVQVRRIYGEGLATGVAAFVSVTPIWNDWDAGHLATGRIVARDIDDRVLGWSALAHAPDN
jgi:L-amino acid N-acyltransferase YncA